MRQRIFSRLGLFALALVGFTGQIARADPVADFYRNRDLRLIISASAGGGYDIYARVVAKHLNDHIAGHPTIIDPDPQIECVFSIS